MCVSTPVPYVFLKVHYLLRVCLDFPKSVSFFPLCLSENLGFYSVWGARSRKPLILQCLARPWARKPVFYGVSRARGLLRAPGSSCGPDSVATRILGGETAPGPFRLVFYKVNGPRAIPTRILRGEAAPGPFRLLFYEKKQPRGRSES